MTSTARDNILHRIRTGLKHGAPRERPPVSEVWPQTSPSREELLERFTSELETVSGEVLRCASMEDAASKLGSLLGELDEQGPLVVMDRPLCREVTAGANVGSVAWGKEDEQKETDPKAMAKVPASLIAADYLLADTGSCVVSCDTPYERLLCYLPPVCIVIAKADQLHEHLPAAWGEIARRTAEPERRGEFVIITGPSRTADIEKILILGVHGPKRLVVLLVD